MSPRGLSIPRAHSFSYTPWKPESRAPMLPAPRTASCVLSLPAPPSRLPRSPAPPISLRGPLVIASSLPRAIHHGSPHWPSCAPELILPCWLPQWPLSCPLLVPLPHPSSPFHCPIILRVSSLPSSGPEVRPSSLPSKTALGFPATTEHKIQA